MSSFATSMIDFPVDEYAFSKSKDPERPQARDKDRVSCRLIELQTEAGSVAKYQAFHFWFYSFHALKRVTTSNCSPSQRCANSYLHNSITTVASFLNHKDLTGPGIEPEVSAPKAETLTATLNKRGSTAK